jgi:hypothetical protein
MNLFEIKEDQVTFSPQALSLSPFRKIWDKDKSKSKAKAIATLSAVYYFADYKSDFAEILDTQEKIEAIKSVIVGMPKDWEPDADFNNAVTFYKDRQQTVTTKLLDDARYAVSKVSTYLREVDLTETDSNGKLIHDAKKIADTIGNLSKITESMKKLEDAVKKEIQHKDSLRGGHTKATFEDGI